MSCSLLACSIRKLLQLLHGLFHFLPKRFTVECLLHLRRPMPLVDPVHHADATAKEMLMRFCGLSARFMLVCLSGERTYEILTCSGLFVLCAMGRNGRGVVVDRLVLSRLVNETCRVGDQIFHENVDLGDQIFSFAV